VEKFELLTQCIVSKHEECDHEKLARAVRLCDGEWRTVNRASSIITGSNQYPVGESIAIFVAGHLWDFSWLNWAERSPQRNFGLTVELMASVYGKQKLFFFVHVSEFEDGAKKNLDKFFLDAGFASYQYHIVVETLSVTTCDRLKAFDYFSQSGASEHPSINGCGTEPPQSFEIQIMRLATLWERLLFVETFRRQRFAFVVRLRLDTILTSL
jgi:hypothetical protein